MIKTKSINCTFSLRAKMYLKSLKCLRPDNSIFSLAFCKQGILTEDYDAELEAKLVGEAIQRCKNEKGMNKVLKKEFGYDWYMNGLYNRDDLPDDSWLCKSKDNVEFVVTEDFAFDEIEGKKIHINKTGKVILK